MIVKMIPLAVMAECGVKAQSAMSHNQPKNWIATGIILIVWVLFATFSIRFMIHLLISKLQVDASNKL